MSTDRNVERARMLGVVEQGYSDRPCFALRFIRNNTAAVEIPLNEGRFYDSPKRGDDQAKAMTAFDLARDKRECVEVVPQRPMCLNQLLGSKPFPIASSQA